jgi:hypothetical protein
MEFAVATVSPPISASIGAFPSSPPQGTHTCIHAHHLLLANRLLGMYKSTRSFGKSPSDLTRRFLASVCILALLFQLVLSADPVGM